MQRFFSLFTVLIFLCALSSYAQRDSLVFKNNDIIVGDIESMDKGVLTIGTPYSDSDFKIEWHEIEGVFTSHNYLISLSDGRQFNGKIFSLAKDSVQLTTFTYGTIYASMDQIVFLKKVDDSFGSRFYCGIDLGVSLTQANNLFQISTRSTAGYEAKKWVLSAAFNFLFSRQDGTTEIQRRDGNIFYRQIFQRNWYLFPGLTYLANTEQNLDLRINLKLGVGKYFVRTNKVHWGLQVGAANNREKFTGEDKRQNSYEAFFGTDLNLFDVGDLSLITKGNAYPSITESKRWRFDFVFDIKYDLPLDFYIKLGTTINFDNQPGEGGSRTDYVIQSGFGWEWN